jgi:AbrB family looped-hinge helix DNA binding protein
MVPYCLRSKKMPQAIAKITSKGQVTIPKMIREGLNINEEDHLLFILMDDQATIIPIRQRPLAELFASLPATQPYQEQLTVRGALRAELGEKIVRGEE